VLKGLLPDNIDSVSPMGANKIPENQTAGRAFLGAHGAVVFAVVFAQAHRSGAGCMQSILFAASWLRAARSQTLTL
jgi:hypothetical protein